MTFDERKEFKDRIAFANRTLTGGNDPDDPGDVRSAVSQALDILDDLIRIVYEEGP